MSGGTKHAFTGAIYALNEDGNVVVTDDDRQGVFRPDGRWISGELRESDPQMCGWVSNVPGQTSDADSHLSA
jgi:hypothetical protein